MKIMRKKGFTLVEIMIVVAIIALLAAIAIPNLLRARLNANEGAAIGNLHTLVTALGSYQANQSPPSYPVQASAIGIPNLTTPLSDPPYIDTVLAGGTKQGYQFTYAGTQYAYTIIAAPPLASQGKTGVRHFFADESGVIRVGDTVAGTVLE